MRILGIDTATSTASVALLDDENLIGEEIRSNGAKLGNGGAPHVKGNHAEIILPLIQSILAKARIGVADLSGVAVSIGPGSFTGLRIGLATAKGIAYDWGLPIVGISTLLANAARAIDFDGMICSLLDARKGEVYVSLFRRSGGVVSRLTDEQVIPINAALTLLRAHYSAADAVPLLVIGDGAPAYEQLLSSALGANARLSVGERYPSVASRVAELARARIKSESVDDLGTLVPVYLRRPEAEKKKILS